MVRRKKSGEDESNDNINESDDNFGLPDIEYQPLNRDESAPQQEDYSRSQDENEIQPSYSENYDNLDPEPIDDFDLDGNTQFTEEESSSSSIAPKIIGIVVVLAIALGATWFFMVYQPKKKLADEKARRELLEKQAAEDKLRKQAELEAQLKRQQEEQRRADSLANLSKEGTIESLEGRTGRFYVVIASAIDDDLIMDYAKKLRDKGVSSKIIPPPRRGRFYHLSVADGETYSDAQTTADGLRSQYGDGTWVIKY